MMFNRTFLKDIVFSSAALRSVYTKIRAKKGDLIPLEELDNYLKMAEKVYLDSSPNILVGLVKDDDDYNDHVKARAYFPKYERFLKNNSIRYEFFDPFEYGWQEKVKKFDLVVWHTSSDPAGQLMARDKIYLIEKILNICCYPSFHEIWSYENKVNANYMYRHFGLPEIPTFVSHSKKDAIQYIESCDFPLITKIATGSSSYGVEKVCDKRHALKLINRVFSYKGRPTYFPYFGQKNYVYFQKYIEDASYDLRIISVGDKLLGYYRYPNEGDFRASGAGNYEKKAIPAEALELAYKVKELYRAALLVTDFVFSDKEKRYYIIESSIFIGVDTCEQLVIDGKPGIYTRVSEGEFVFESGRYWIQELALKQVIERMT